MSTAKFEHQSQISDSKLEKRVIIVTLAQDYRIWLLMDFPKDGAKLDLNSSNLFER